jgi:hypothetical protein
MTLVSSHLLLLKVLGPQVLEILELLGVKITTIENKQASN